MTIPSCIPHAESPLWATDYFRGHSCKRSAHNEYITAATRPPFQVIGNHVCDNAGAPVQCPFDRNEHANVTTYYDPLTNNPFRLSHLRFGHRLRPYEGVFPTSLVWFHAFRVANAAQASDI